MTANSSRKAFLAALGLCAVLASGASASGLRVLYAFQNSGGDGAHPQASNLVEDKDGNLYGTTFGGGDADCQCGTVFKLTPSGQETVLHRFTGGSDGALPYAGLEKGPDGNLFGTTAAGGTGCSPGGCGTIFEITPDGVETVIYRFAGGADGSDVFQRLRADKHGNLFGTTLLGGDPVCDCGTVFELAPDGSKTILHAFAGGTDGSSPASPLEMDKNGDLFGSTFLGGGEGGVCGAVGCGTVYEVTASGGLSILHAFSGTDGNGPRGSMVLDGDGSLYGTVGGCDDPACYGFIFKIVPGSGFSVLAGFGGSKGEYPLAGITGDGHGNLLGTTSQGGDASCDCGTVFSAAETSGFVEVLHTFRGHRDAYSADNALHADRRGHIYGMIMSGVHKCGLYGCVYSLGAR